MTQRHRYIKFHEYMIPSVVCSQSLKAMAQSFTVMEEIALPLAPVEGARNKCFTALAPLVAFSLIRHATHTIIECCC